MANRSAGFWQPVVVVVCIAGYQWLVHSVLLDGHSAALRLALMCLPLAALAYWIARRAHNQFLWWAILVGASLLIYVVEQKEHLGLVAAYGMPHAAIYSVLLWVFATTLLPGRVALVTRLASRVHGTLPANIEVYTRQVTVAWCVFFAAQLAVSALLLKFSTLSTWSLFVNLLSFPLVGLMFVLEYAYRIVRFPDFAHASLRQTVQSFTDDAAH